MMGEQHPLRLQRAEAPVSAPPPGNQIIYTSASKISVQQAFR